MRAIFLIFIGLLGFLPSADAADRSDVSFIDIFDNIDISQPMGWQQQQPAPALLRDWQSWILGQLPALHEVQGLYWQAESNGLLVVLVSSKTGGDAVADPGRQQVAVYRLLPMASPKQLLLRKGEYLTLLPLSGLDPFSLGAPTLFLYAGSAASEASAEGVEIWRLGEAGTDPLPQDAGIPHAYGTLPNDGRLAVQANNFAWKNYFLSCGSCGVRLPVFAVPDGAAFTLACTAFKSRYDVLARAALADADARQRQQGDLMSIWDRRLLAVLAWLQAGQPDKAWPVFQALLLNATQKAAMSQEMRPWPERLRKDIAPLFTLPPVYAACPLQGRPYPPSYAEEG